MLVCGWPGHGHLYVVLDARVVEELRVVIQDCEVRVAALHGLGTIALFWTLAVIQAVF